MDLRDALFNMCLVPTCNWVYLWISTFFYWSVASSIGLFIIFLTSSKPPLIAQNMLRYFAVVSIWGVESTSLVSEKDKSISLFIGISGNLYINLRKLASIILDITTQEQEMPLGSGKPNFRFKRGILAFFSYKFVVFQSLFYAFFIAN